MSLANFLSKMSFYPFPHIVIALAAMGSVYALGGHAESTAQVTRQKLCEPALTTSDFTIRSGDIWLNPLTREVKVHDKVFSLARQLYMVFEMLLLADGAPVPVSEIEDEALMNAQGEEPSLRDWVAQKVLLLRKT
ncbi:MAG: hypothetical protein HC902_10920 [Calothrix sp. SM1_5_4]|nr:hypothetical protein [Calothrix sp. SM1_5_4]